MQEQVPEKYGNYTYFVREVEYPTAMRKAAGGDNHFVEYCRLPVNAPTNGEEHLQQVLSIPELVNVGFVPQKHLKTTVVDKIKLNDDHSLLAFTVDIGNHERCTGGLKDMETG